VVDLDAHPDRVRERLGADRADHELLDVDVVVGVRSAVHHVHERNREDARADAAEVAVERQVLGERGRTCDRHRAGEERVRSEPCLVGAAVEVEQQLVHAALIASVEADQLVRDLLVYIADRLVHSLAAPHAPCRHRGVRRLRARPYWLRSVRRHGPPPRLRW
jgi:hypothetical protein